MKIQKVFLHAVAISALFTIANCGITSKNNLGYLADSTELLIADSTAVSDSAAEEEIPPFQNPPDKIWELLKTDLQINLDWQNRQIHGTATLELQPYFYKQDSLVLDAIVMNFKSIVILGAKPELNIQPKYQYIDSEHLVLYLPKSYEAKEKIQIRIDYIANPEHPKLVTVNKAGDAIGAEKGGYFINHDLSNPCIPRQFWTQGETRGSRCWFPTIDQMNQKHLQQITITYPDTMISISNGYKISHTLNSAKHEFTDVWKMTQPHSVYLTMLAVGNWAEITDKYKDKVLHYYVEPKFKNDAKKIFGNTPEMIEFFSQYTGVEFPWNKYDQVVVRNFVSGAMENTTAVVHTEGLQDKDNDMEDYISHELFHHWFGDYVTADNWGEITMNESFAKYAEFLWIEHKYGYEKSQIWLQENNEGWMSSEKKNALVNYNYNHPDEQFDQIRYNKGAAILNMLRNYIGDAAFRLAIKEYLTTYAYSNAGSAEWKRCVEKVTGKNLSLFFNAWYYSPGDASIYWSYKMVDFDSNRTKLKHQVELFQFNKLNNIKPFKIDIEYGKIGGEKKYKSIIMDETFEDVDLELTESPDYIHIDPNNTLVGSISSNHVLYTDVPSDSGTLANDEKNQFIKILQNNYLTSKNTYQRSKNIVDYIVSVNAMGYLESLDSNTIKKLLFEGISDNNAQVTELLYELLNFLKIENPNADNSNIPSDYLKLNQRVFANAQISPKIKAKVLYLNLDQHFKEGTPFPISEQELLEFSKSEDFELFEAVISSFSQLDCFSKIESETEEDELETPLNKESAPFWVTHAESQFSATIDSKRKSRWACLLIEYYMFENKIDDIGKTIKIAEKSNIHIEEFSALYETLNSFLVNNYGQTEKAMLCITNEIDRIISSKNMTLIKLMKYVLKSEYELRSELENTTESERVFNVSLKKLYNFEIK